MSLQVEGPDEWRTWVFRLRDAPLAAIMWRGRRHMLAPQWVEVSLAVMHSPVFVQIRLKGEPVKRDGAAAGRRAVNEFLWSGNFVMCPEWVVDIGRRVPEAAPLLPNRPTDEETA